MRTGELVKASGLPRDTIRYYEQMGLIPAPTRTSNNYKTYPRETIELLEFIVTAKGLGFTLNEIKDTLHLYHNDSLYCDSAIELLKGKLLQVNDKLKQLEMQRKRLMGEIHFFQDKKGKV